MSSAFRDYRTRTFASLSLYNYRLFFIGQCISQSGTWMQTIAQGLLVLQITGSGTALGIVTALQTLPVLIFGAWGGVFADRMNKRSVLYVTNSIFGIGSLATGILTVSGDIQLWMVYIVGLVFGFTKVFDNPARQTFIREMVGNDYLQNAVSLNSTQMNLARVIGPSIAGLTAATIGLGACFIFDAASYAIVFSMLHRMRESELHPAKKLARAKGQLVEGFRYAAETPMLRTILLMMAIIGTFTFEFSVLLPLFAEFTFHRGAGGYAALTSAMGVGAVVGGLYTASRKVRGTTTLVLSAALFGVSVAAASLAPTLIFAVAAFVVVGFFSINFTSLANSTLQMHTIPAMQGRVMALWSIAFLGTTPIGGPIMGFVGQHAGARWGLLLGGIAAIIAAGAGLISVSRSGANVIPATVMQAVPSSGTAKASGAD
ncbi:MAG TPA: MFS transporter [Thermomicrobiales bacterium]|nr:MFS transporter [Thermomicrobiales bacterium]